MIMRKIMTILIVLAILTIYSCGTKTQYEGGGRESRDVIEMVMEDSSLPNEQNLDKIETEERKIIKEGYIEFETDDVNKTKSLILQTVQELNGYISNDNNHNYYPKQLTYRLEIHVPADKFDLLLNGISESVKKLDSKNINVRDVTAEYIDIEARIKTKKALQNRYIELLKQATKVDEILNIEKEIGTLQTEIESVEGRMRYLNNRIAFSTLSVNFYQKESSTFGFTSKFVDGIKNGWSVFLWVIIGISNLWVFIIAAAVAFYLIRMWKKKTIKNK